MLKSILPCGLAMLAFGMAAMPAAAATENLIVNGTFDNFYHRLDRELPDPQQ
jgi:hypothetical protein